MAPESKSGDAGNLGTTEGSAKCFLQVNGESGTRRERPHSITFITVFCYYCFIIVVTVPNLEVKFYHTSMCKEKTEHIEFSTVWGFRHPLGGLGTYPVGNGGQLYYKYLPPGICPSCCLRPELPLGPPPGF